ncbi:hypothetical protein [Mycobacterium parmense]|uniref:Uncharacterized protein n=1 Tax=Mycobacterium parmense TaxID=185642 RepID=A0A7I7YU92_9MYCO|nr:hypothetical protein [Mycobacterium parmense]MCV7351107.1 hypothetical protein [Mycobacterium parmense]ORW60670.1 hypothetical protein AWC20_06795 [Mycobacterium parmense]BBZ45448.1 hypothetical protein MPRM_27290 [Mycobacterium parmense]
MVTALGEWLTTWRTSEHPSIRIARVQWRELEQVTVSGGLLRQFVETSSVAADVLAALFRVRRVLTATPLAPTDPVAGLTDTLGVVERFLAERPDHTLCDRLRVLSDALYALAVSSSPIAAQVEDVLCEYGATPEGRPEVILMVPRPQWLEPISAWLAGNDLNCVDTACPADLRRAPVTHQAAVLIGHPATAFSSPFRAADVTMRELGWLLTAPVAPEVRVVLTADAPRLRANDLWLLPPTGRPQLALHDDGPQRSEPALHGWLHGREASAAAQRTPRPAATATEDMAEAVEVQVASGHAIFFHPEIGPRPHVVAVDDETDAVALSAVSLATVARGVVLAVRVGAAPHAQLVARADAWLERRRGWSPGRILEVRGYVAKLKTALRSALAAHGHAALRRDLAQTLSDDYARVLLRNPLDESYIAPLHEHGFNALVRTISASELLGRFGDLTTVRTAHHQAGEEIRRDLLALLGDRTWVADVDENGWAVLHAGDLGSLLLAVVTARLDEPVAVPRTWLGVPIDAAGRRVTALTATTGCA